MKLVFSTIVLLGQRIPYIRNLPFLRDAGTVEAAIRALTKAVDQMVAVENAKRAEVKALETVIANAREQKTEALEQAARAARVSSKINDLLA